MKKWVKNNQRNKPIATKSRVFPFDGKAYFVKMKTQEGGA